MSKIVRVVCYLTLCLLRAWWTHDNTFVPPSCTLSLAFCLCAVRVLYVCCTHAASVPRGFFGLRPALSRCMSSSAVARELTVFPPSLQNLCLSNLVIIFPTLPAPHCDCLGSWTHNPHPLSGPCGQLRVAIQLLVAIHKLLRRSPPFACIECCFFFSVQRPASSSRVVAAQQWLLLYHFRRPSTHSSVYALHLNGLLGSVVLCFLC